MGKSIQWEMKAAEEVDIDSEKLKGLGDALNYQPGIINSILIVRRGSTVYEKYFRGAGKENIHDVTSITQNITSSLIGIAIERGDIRGANQKVLDFFPEAAGSSDILKQSLTIKHLLTMTTPYTWKGKEPLDRIRRQKNWTSFLLKSLGKNAKLGEYQYNLSSAHLLSAIISRSTGVSAREYANEHLFRPTGMREITDQNMKSFSKENMFGKNIMGWIKDPQDYNTGGWGLTLTARDMVRLGYLYVNKGKWEERQVIPERWIEESFAQHTEDFGYMWWMREDQDVVTYIAAGLGGTYIYCIPEKELVVVVVSDMDKMIIDRWELMEDYIIPSIMD